MSLGQSAAHCIHGDRIRPSTAPAIPLPHTAAQAAEDARHRWRHPFTPAFRMVPCVLTVEGRRLRYAVSDNEDAHGPGGPGTPPVWAVNIHGYFAGGGMYWRESARLAEDLGWRLINPSLPAFGGSDPLPWGEVSMTSLAEQVGAIIDHVATGPVVLLGHSMGGAVATHYAYHHPERTLGIIYRDGVGTPGWKKRRGLVPFLMGPISPDVAAITDLVLSIVLDLPDLFMGRVLSTVRSVLPEFRRNIRVVGRTMPVGSMLMAADLSDEIAQLVEGLGIPLLPVWGVLDRVAGPGTAAEFSECSGQEVQWVPGGHSWMLARPQGQSDVLRRLERGQHFLAAIENRWRLLHGLDAPLVTLDDQAPPTRRMRVVH